MEKKTIFPSSVLLIFLVIFLAAIPLVVKKDAEFGGADGEAEGVIAEVAPEYEPWFEGFWSPPSGEIESLLFCLQAALGAGVVFYGLGYIRAKKKAKGA